jgi:CRP/FNR family transcriptional regulator, cyclic AMP receptor protein
MRAKLDNPHSLDGRLAGTSFFWGRFITRERRNAEMLEASAKSSNILSALPDRLSSHLFARATARHLRAGETLFYAGDVGNGCYRLDRGVLKVSIDSERGETLTLAVVGAGSIVGELALIDGRPRSASIVAVKDCELSFISRAHFEECVLHPEFGRYLLNVLATRLRQADEALAASSFLPVKARIARVLLDLAKNLGENTASGHIMIGHKISQADLAAMAGVARENVNRILRHWERLKIVTQLSSFYSLNNCAALERELKNHQRDYAIFKRKALTPTMPPTLISREGA